MRVLITTFALAAGVAAACAKPEAVASRPWSTAVDSLGDTVFLRVTGEVPAAMYASVEPELKIGAVDGAEEYTFGQIVDVLPTADGGVLVHDDQAQLIRFYDSTGTYVRTLGAKGQGPGEYEQVNGITLLPDGEILVWDGTGGRINRYRADGTFINQFRLGVTTWFTSNALYSDDAGRIYHWAPIGEDPQRPLEHRSGLLRVDTLGTVLDTIEFRDYGPAPATLEAVSLDGGSRSRTIVPFQPSSFTSLLRSGGLATGFGGSYRFVIQHPNAKPRVVLREVAPAAVSATERQERRALIEQNFKRMVPTWTWTGPDLPTTKPAFAGFRVATDGRLWVVVPATGEPIPAEELAPVTPPASGGPPPVRLSTREPGLFDVYEPDGTLIGRVAVPARTRIFRFGATHVWGTLRDADDVDYAVRFRITGLSGDTP